MSPEPKKRAPGDLAVVVRLSRKLNTRLTPEDQLLAYCQTVKSLCPWMDGLYLVFVGADGEPEASMVFVDPDTSTVRTGDLSHRMDGIRRMIETESGGKGAEGGTGSRSDRREGGLLLRDLFPGGEGFGGRAAGRPKTEEGNHRPATASDPLTAFPLRTRAGTEAWVLPAGPDRERRSLTRGRRDVLSVCTDILATSLERMSLFQKILHAKKEWEQSMDAIRDVVMVIDAAYTVRRGNRRLAELAGVRVEELTGLTCHQLLASSSRICPACPVSETRKTFREATSEVFRPGRGTVFQVGCYPIPAPSGGMESVAVYEKDVTTIKEMQEKLLFSEKMAVIGRMAAGVAHEINNPLSGVISLSKLVLNEMDPGLPYVEDLKNIEHAALRCKKIVQDLLLFSRKPEREARDPVDLESVLERVRGVLYSHLQEAGVGMEWTISHDVPLLPYHPDSLQQILMNLVTNARDAMRSGGCVRIHAERTKKKGKACLLLRVEDAGQGMDACQREKIFEPFYTTKGPGEGTGLGLSICQNLMESFGGSMEVWSQPGKGTVVSLWFPLKTGFVDERPSS